MDVKRFFELIRSKMFLERRRALLFSLFRRSKRKGFVTFHEKRLRGGTPISRRIKRKIRKWRDLSYNSYSLSRKSQLTRRSILSYVALIVLLIILFNFRGTIRQQFSELDIFFLTNIQVKGCLKTTPAEIREYVKLKYNTKLLAIDTEALEEQLENHPWVFQAKITRRLPDTLVIDLQENIPKGIVQLGKQRDLYYIDQFGTPFVMIKPGQDMDFPVITGVATTEGMVKNDNGPLYGIMKFLKKTDSDDPNLPAQSVSQIHFDAAEGAILYLVDFPFPIFLGKDNIQNKYNRLKKVVGFLYKERKRGMNINSIAYVRMDYSSNKVLVAHTAQVDQ